MRHVKSLSKNRNYWNPITLLRSLRVFTVRHVSEEINRLRRKTEMIENHAIRLEKKKKKTNRFFRKNVRVVLIYVCHSTWGEKSKSMRSILESHRVLGRPPRDTSRTRAPVCVAPTGRGSDRPNAARQQQQQPVRPYAAGRETDAAAADDDDDIREQVHAADFGYTTAVSIGYKADRRTCVEPTGV